MENIKIHNNYLAKGYRPLKEHVKFRPKARLLSILGEQLISNEIIALKELVLNAFDADADVVHINFNKDSSNQVYEITITDNGNGMDENKIINGWFVPATSLKTIEKKNSNSPKYNRPIMGEKGVGRFACRRLGESLEILTKIKDYKIEFSFNVEWSQYDVDQSDIYLEDIDNTLYSRPIDSNSIESSLTKYESGTCLKISILNDLWDQSRIENIKLELLKLIPPFQGIKDFKLFIDEVELKNEIFLEKALFYMEGIIDIKGTFHYIIGTYPREHQLKPGELFNLIDFSKNIEEQLSSLQDKFNKDNLLDSALSPKTWKNYIDTYLEKGVIRTDEPLCGNITFSAYSWDLDAINKKRVGINDKQSLELLKNFCGISIYRDGFRIWPYGSPGNDWLDLNRRAQGGQKPFHIANHQVIGYIGISQKYHPYFKDKTNREGFIENGQYFGDFKQLILLSFRHLEALRHRNNSKNQPAKAKEWWQEDKVLNVIDELKEEAKQKAPELIKTIEQLDSEYKNRKKQTENKITNLLEVSSTGIVYESVTHELISFLNKMDEQSIGIEECLNVIPPKIKEAINSNILLKEALKIVLFEVKELQPYFKAARYQLKELDIKEVAEKAMKYFRYRFKNNNINYRIAELSSMKRKAVEGFILQILTNLIDNSIYWLDYDNNQNKQMLITIDGNNNVLYFSDNGKGISNEDIPYIFNPFFTRKDEGRGLGLYIVQELLANYRGEISIDDNYKPEDCSDKRKGACFKIYIP